LAQLEAYKTHLSCTGVGKALRHKHLHLTSRVIGVGLNQGGADFGILLSPSGFAKDSLKQHNRTALLWQSVWYKIPEKTATVAQIDV
jgi:hypothetical protein